MKRKRKTTEQIAEQTKEEDESSRSTDSDSSSNKRKLGSGMEMMQQKRKQKTGSKGGPFDPLTYDIRMTGMQEFIALVKRHGFKFTRFTSPKRCPICSEGPLESAMYENLMKQVGLVPSMKPEELQIYRKELEKYRKATMIFELHKKQREVCRAATQDLDMKLKAGESWIVRDFVNHHDHAGEHVKCLHWVIRWRDVDNEPIKMIKVRIYCSSKSMATDNAYTADTDAFLLPHRCEQPVHLQAHFPGLLDTVHRITFTSDHGSHLCCLRLFLLMCSYYRRFGMEFALLFFEAYHGEGRCDGMGSQDKVDAVRKLREGLLLFGAADFARMTNSNNDCQSIAWEFLNINRSSDVLPAKKDIVSYAHHRKWCQISFEYEGRCEATEGVIKYRYIPNNGP